MIGAVCLRACLDLVSTVLYCICYVKIFCLKSTTQSHIVLFCPWFLYTVWDVVFSLAIGSILLDILLGWACKHDKNMIKSYPITCDAPTIRALGIVLFPCVTSQPKMMGVIHIFMGRQHREQLLRLSNPHQHYSTLSYTFHATVSYGMIQDTNTEIHWTSWWTRTQLLYLMVLQSMHKHYCPLSLPCKTLKIFLVTNLCIARRGRGAKPYHHSYES